MNKNPEPGKNVEVDEKEGSTEAETIHPFDARINEIKIKLKTLSENYRIQSARNQTTIRQFRENIRSRQWLNSTTLAHLMRPEAFARECVRLGREIRADAYICHDTETLLAADYLRTKARLIVFDSIETFSYRERSAHFFRPLDPFLHALDRANVGLLSTPDMAMAASKSICRELGRAGLRTVYIPDYPALRALGDAPEVRKACGLASTARLIVVPGDIDPSLGLETIIAALRHLPENYHIATVGDIYPQTYKSRLAQFVLGNDLQSRVHVLGAIEYEIRPAFVRGADVGVMAQDPRIPGHKSALPGAVFDCICAGLPVAAGDLPDIQEIVSAYSVGGRFERASPRSIAATVEDLVERKAEMTPGLRRAAHELVWAENEAKIVDIFGTSESVTILGVKGLVSDIRTRNIARTLIRHGIGVTILTPEVLCGERRGGRPTHPVPGVKYVHSSL